MRRVTRELSCEAKKVRLVLSKAKIKTKNENQRHDTTKYVRKNIR